jgi:hypothetical protein
MAMLRQRRKGAIATLEPSAPFPDGAVVVARTGQSFRFPGLKWFSGRLPFLPFARALLSAPDRLVLGLLMADTGIPPRQSRYRC